MLKITDEIHIYIYMLDDNFRKLHPNIFEGLHFYLGLKRQLKTLFYTTLRCKKFYRIGPRLKKPEKTKMELFILTSSPDQISGSLYNQAAFPNLKIRLVRYSNSAYAGKSL